MRIYFAPCGIGLGHVGRTVPIARKLLEKNASILFSTYQEGIDYVKNEKLPLVRSPGMGVQVKPDGSVDFRRTVMNPGPFLATYAILQQINAELRSMASFQPDVVVSDSRASSLIAARLLRIPRICILNQFNVFVPRRKRFLRLARLADVTTLALIGMIWASNDSVLVPDFPQPYTICSGNLNVPKYYRNKAKLIGPILPVHPSNLSSVKDLRKKLGLPTDKTMIFALVSGPTKEKAFITGALRKALLEFPADYEIVMSYGYPGTGSEPIRQRNVTIFKWLPNRFEYLKACDIAIGRAGHGTITQSMSYGKPMIIIPTPNHTEQLQNAIQAEKLGIAETLLQRDVTRYNLLKTVERLMKSDAVYLLQRMQPEILKHDGLDAAVKEIECIAER